MKRIELFTIFFFALLLTIPLFLTVSNTFPRLDTDYDSSLPIYQYMVTSIHIHHTLPLVIPFVSTGIPVLGDPLNSFLNPLLSVPFVLFGINGGLRVSIFLSLLFSGCTMFVLLKKLRLHKFFILFGSLLYMSSGAFIAQVASGHIEKFLAYPFVPLILLVSLRQQFTLRHAFYASCIVAATVYSGDLYATWFFFLFFLTIRIFYLTIAVEYKWKSFLWSIFVIPLFIVLSSVKLFPFLTDVLPFMKRYFSINPFQGSIHAMYLPLPFIMPFQVQFYDRPFFQRHIGFSFNWYEYYAFITPLPFLFLIKIKQVIHNTYVQIFLLLILVSALYVSLGFFYSPFYWLTKLLGEFAYFRVPQRIVLPLTSVVIALLCLCGNFWFSQKKSPRILIILLAILSLCWTTIVFWQTLFVAFPRKNFPQEHLIRELQKKDTSTFTLAKFAPQTQFFLSEGNVRITNYYYGWVPKATETYSNATGVVDYTKLIDEKPLYVVTTPFVNLFPYGYTMFLKNSTIQIWKK